MAVKRQKERGIYNRPDSPYYWIRYSNKHGKTIQESTGTKSKVAGREILDSLASL